jgi:hypothetical protein
VTEGEKVSGVLRKMLKAERLSRDAKRSMCESIVVPTLLYGSKVWATSAEDRSDGNEVHESYVWSKYYG